MDDARVIDPEDPRWPEAERRDALLRRLLKASGWKLTREVVEPAREELGIPRPTLFRLVGRFHRTKRATSLLPQGLIDLVMAKPIANVSLMAREVAAAPPRRWRARPARAHRTRPLSRPGGSCDAMTATAWQPGDATGRHLPPGTGPRTRRHANTLCDQAIIPSKPIFA
jgi:hypothetical protein